MAGADIDPGKVSKPIQMLAVLAACLVLTVTALLTGAANISAPAWVAPMLAVAAVISIPIFIGTIVLMWTKFRPHLQEDRYYSQWLKRQEEAFKDFRPENVEIPLSDTVQLKENSGIKFSPKVTGRLQTNDPALMGFLRTENTPETSNILGRADKYQRNRGVFLVHSWRPSSIPGQLVDVVIEPIQHGEGPLKAGLVESVTYDLGPRFFRGNKVEKNDASDHFRLHVSAYGPMLCLADVKVKGSDELLHLERYIDFTA